MTQKHKDLNFAHSSPVEMDIETHGEEKTILGEVADTDPLTIRARDGSDYEIHGRCIEYDDGLTGRFKSIRLSGRSADDILSDTQGAE